jgi:hypothetical protein
VVVECEIRKRGDVRIVTIRLTMEVECKNMGKAILSSRSPPFGIVAMEKIQTF